MNQSILGHVIPKVTQAEPAATRALRYLLETSDTIAKRFLAVVGSTPFEIGRIGSEWNYAAGVRPDIAIHDAATGDHRVFVENKFRAWLTDFQPVDYLKALPERDTSVLAFIAPEDRIEELWGELQARCRRADFNLSKESTTAYPYSIRAGARRLVLTNWRAVLDTLQHAAAAAGHPALEYDIVQLRGLTEEMRRDAPEATRPNTPARVSFAGSDETFPPLHANEPTDAGAARRLLDYCGLIDEITKKLVAAPSWDTKGMRATGFGRYLHVHGRFDLYLRVSFTSWGNHGITPLWCTCLGVERQGRDVHASFDGAHVDDAGRPNIPIRLKTGVERGRVIDHAADQMRAIADHLLNSAEGRNALDLSP